MEIWKEIVGYEGRYLISSSGKVKSLYRNKILKHSTSSNGYLGVSLSKESKIKTFHIHRLLAEHFLSNPKNLPCVNHKDGNKHNNEISNLEWSTFKENTDHAIKTNLMKVKGNSHPMFGKKHKKESKQKMREAKLGKSGSEHPRSTKVAKLDPTTEIIIEIYESQHIAAKENSLSQGTLNLVLNGKRKTTGGFKWKFIN